MRKRQVAMARWFPKLDAPDALPRHRGIFLVQPDRGGWQARRWPRKRGKTKDQRQKWLQEQFRLAQRWSVTSEPRQLITAYEHTKGTEILPRDLLVMAAYGRAYQIVLEDGRTLQPTVKSAPPSLGPHGETFMGALIWRSTNQAIPALTTTPIVYDTIAYDLGGWADLALHPSGLQVPAGIKRVRITAGALLTTVIQAGTNQIWPTIAGGGGYPGRPTDQHYITRFFTVSSPAVEVVQNQLIECQINLQGARTVQGHQTTFLAVEEA